MWVGRYLLLHSIPLVGSCTRSSLPQTSSLGRIYACQRQWPDALREYKKGLRLSPEDLRLLKAREEARIPFNPLPYDVPEDQRVPDASDNPAILEKMVVPPPLVLLEEEGERLSQALVLSDKDDGGGCGGQTVDSRER